MYKQSKQHNHNVFALNTLCAVVLNVYTIFDLFNLIIAMLRTIFTQIATSQLRRRNGFLHPQSMPLIQFQVFQSAYVNKTAEDWVKTLPEDKMKRIRLIQNEVSFWWTTFFSLVANSGVVQQLTDE